MVVPIQSRCCMYLWFLGETCNPAGRVAHLSARQEASDKILELPHWFLRSQRYKHRLIILWKACICSGVPCVSMAEKSSSEVVKNRWIFRDRPFWSIPLPVHDSSPHTLILLLYLRPKSFLAAGAHYSARNCHCSSCSEAVTAAGTNSWDSIDSYRVNSSLQSYSTC